MRPLASRALPAIVMSLAVGWGVAGCSTDENGGNTGAGSAAVGTWNATNFTAAGTDLIAAGMTMAFTFNTSGTYSFSITNDQGGLCDGPADCTDGGDYTATDTQITLDPGTIDVAVLNYSINGNTMSISTTIDGVAITGTFDKQ